MFVLVSYDISDTKRLAKVAKVLLDFGTRVQYSVFECNLLEKELETLRTRLEKVFNAVEDSIRFYFLCGTCVAKSLVLGRGELTKDQDIYVI
jgi:CRISPR-associated protein Cas2